MRLALVAPLFLCACGSHRDFALPPPSAEPAIQTYRWQPLPEPVLTRDDSADVLNPSVVRFRGALYNLYSAFDGRTWHTALATSTDGHTWSKQGRTLSPGTGEGDYIAANGSALVYNNQCFYWYQTGPRDRPYLALANAGDCRTYRKAGPVLEPGPYMSWDERGVADPYVIATPQALYLFYLGQDRARRQRLGIARSTDGRHWEKLRANPILELGDAGAFDENGLGEPAVWAAGGAYWMLYTGRDRSENRRLGLARSRDGIQWEKLPGNFAGDQPWNTHVICDATVLPAANGVIDVWFGGGNVASPDERLNGQIGFARLVPVR